MQNPMQKVSILSRHDAHVHQGECMALEAMADSTKEQAFSIPGVHRMMVGLPHRAVIHYPHCMVIQQSQGMVIQWPNNMVIQRPRCIVILLPHGRRLHLSQIRAL